MSNIAEKAVIGCILLDINSIRYVYDSLKKDMFFDPVYRDAFGEIQKNYDLGIRKNVAQIAQAIQSDTFSSDQLAKYLIECTNSVSTSLEIKSYGNVVVNDYKAYSLSKLVQTVKPSSYEINRQIGELINELEVLKGQDRITAKSLSDIVNENAPNRFVEKKKEQILTGFSKLDDCLGSLEGGDIIVVAARPGVGKSAITAEITLNMAKQKKRVCFYNLEMTDPQVYDRLLSHESEMDLTRIRRAEAFLGDEKEKFEKANNVLYGLDIIIGTGSKSVSEIRNEVRHLDVDCIVIDYLQLLKSDEKCYNRTEEVGKISRAMKSLSTELKVPIIVLSQLNRLSEMRQTKEPTMSELRNSGDIEQDASIIIMMWNTDETDESRKGLKVEKNRNGTLMQEVLRFDGAHMHFRETDEPINNRDGFKKAKAWTPFDEE